MTLPNIAVGARFWSYHVKPANNYAYFTSGTIGSPPEGDDLWGLNTAADLWFSPVQICVSFEADAASQTLEVEVLGIDQFGYPADELLVLTRTESTDWVRQGTSRCYSSITSLIISSATATLSGNNYQVGIGVSTGGSGTEAKPDDSYRIALPARARDSTQVKAVQDVLSGDVFRPNVSPVELTVNLEHESLEFILTGDSPSVDRYYAVVMEPNSTSI